MTDRSVTGARNLGIAIFNRESVINDSSVRPLGKIFITQKQITQFFFFSEQHFEVGYRVLPNFSIRILILLTGFYKFPKSIGPNCSAASHVRSFTSQIHSWNWKSGSRVLRDGWISILFTKGENIQVWTRSSVNQWVADMGRQWSDLSPIKHF